MKIIAILLLTFVQFQVIASNVVVVHAENTNEISLSDVKKIYLGKKGAFNDGNAALPITLVEGDAVRASFNQAVLNKNEVQYVAYWSKMVFTGKGSPPKEIATMEELKKLVSKNPSVIGFIDKSMVDSTLKVIGEF